MEATTKVSIKAPSSAPSTNLGRYADDTRELYRKIAFTTVLTQQVLPI